MRCRIWRSLWLVRASAKKPFRPEASWGCLLLAVVGMALVISPAHAEDSEHEDVAVGACAPVADFARADPEARPEDTGFVYHAEFVADGRQGRALAIRMANEHGEVLPGDKREWVVRTEAADSPALLYTYLEPAKHPDLWYVSRYNNNRRRHSGPIAKPFHDGDGVVPTLQQMLGVEADGELPRVELTCKWTGMVDDRRRARQVLRRTIDVHLAVRVR